MGMDAGAETGPYAIVTGASGTGSRQILAEQLFAAHYPKLAGWVRRLVDDDDTAHEIASEAFVRLLSKWTSLDKLDSPQSYLYMIATNLVRDHWRKMERERRAFARRPRAPTPSRTPTRRRTSTSGNSLPRCLPGCASRSCCTTTRGSASGRSPYSSSGPRARSRRTYTMPGGS